MGKSKLVGLVAALPCLPTISIASISSTWFSSPGGQVVALKKADKLPVHIDGTNHLSSFVSFMKPDSGTLASAASESSGKLSDRPSMLGHQGVFGKTQTPVERINAAFEAVKDMRKAPDQTEENVLKLADQASSPYAWSLASETAGGGTKVMPLPGSFGTAARPRT